jgi:hypothetical protein
MKNLGRKILSVNCPPADRFARPDRAVDGHWRGYRRETLVADISPLKEKVWRADGGLMPSEARKLRQLEEKNARLPRLVANLSLYKEMFQEIIRKKL